jgi:hypothetical protein
MINPSAEAAHERARDITGVEIIFQRVNGFSPNTRTVSAQVKAVVRDYLPDTTAPEQTGYGATKQGGITQGDRKIVVLKKDLERARFPLPLRKKDKVILVETGEQITITEVDAFKRAMAGAIEVTVSGVA